MGYSSIAIVFLSFGTMVFVFFKPSKITNYPASGDSIVMFGDSLVQGIGATQGSALPELLSRKIHERIINMGIAGETSAQGLARIEKVLDKNPRIVLVLFGGNDYLREVDTQITFKNITRIVEILQDYGAVVILLGIQGGILSDPYAGEFKKIARDRGALYVPNVLEGIIGEENLMSDEVHPNDTGYNLVANKIYPILKKAL